MDNPLINDVASCRETHDHPSLYLTVIQNVILMIGYLLNSLRYLIELRHQICSIKYGQDLHIHRTAGLHEIKGTQCWESKLGV